MDLKKVAEDILREAEVSQDTRRDRIALAQEYLRLQAQVDGTSAPLVHRAVAKLAAAERVAACAVESRDNAVTERDRLRAARVAYASEFDGDVGNIHENIRRLKTLATAVTNCFSGRDGALYLEAPGAQAAEAVEALRAFLKGMKS